MVGQSAGRIGESGVISSSWSSGRSGVHGCMSMSLELKCTSAFGSSGQTSDSIGASSESDVDLEADTLPESVCSTSESIAVVCYRRLKVYNNRLTCSSWLFLKFNGLKSNDNFLVSKTDPLDGCGVGESESGIRLQNPLPFFRNLKNYNKKRNPVRILI